MNPEHELIKNVDKLHTTQLGVKRVQRNLGLDTIDIVDWCKKKCRQADEIVRNGKNWYVYLENAVITINAHSYTIITAHKREQQEKVL